MLSTRNVHISSEAVFLSGLFFRFILSSSSIAMRPGPVALHPVPSIFMIKLIVIYSAAFSPSFPRRPGNSHSTTGLSHLDNSFTMPALSAISMIPHHIATIPAMDITSSTA